MTTPPEHADLIAAGWHHTPTVNGPHYMRLDGPRLTMTARLASDGWYATVYFDTPRGDVSTGPHPTHAAALAALHDVARALLALEVAP